MFIQQLKAGDHFTQENHGEAIRFEVLAIEQIGSQFQVWFRSKLGLSDARYHGKAVLPCVRPAQALHA
ncbi:hypothetical protein [Chitinimonas sp.]|uniref:hypothetical protein n=1 Tax=Chitinimonas sp. TaxID=1934313 RepID=UPI002F94939F